MARFAAERQALAMMDHPNIARVLDGGITNQGRPYFVMELVRGTAITTFCDERKLDLHERLRLFITVCQAIQHAHQKGIIHRDIKPSNVMVALFGDKPVPKVIDFGVAKASDSELLDFSVHTGFDSVVGTMEYMSPEQALLNNIDIDSRSDVYSLGVLLYELIAGSPPFRRSELAEQGMLEVLRVIREVDPQRPSLKLSSSKMRASIAALRNTEPNALGRLLRSELDWIVMKTIEKERARRYDSAGGLARDIDRFLANEPVEACPPSAGYKLRKFLSRNRAFAIGATLLLMTLLAGIVGTSIGLFRAEAARRIAETAQRAESDQAEGERTAKLDALAQKKLAEQAEDATMESYRASTDDAIKQLIGSKPMLGPQERSYLENALKRWQAFADRQGNDERSRAIRCEGHFYLGVIWERLGQYSDAKSSLERAVAIWERLAEDFPGKTDYRNDFSDARRELANVLQKLGNFANAEEQLRKAIEIQEKLVAEFPGEPTFRFTLGTCHTSLGNLLKSLGRPEAKEQHRTGLLIFEKLAADVPSDPRYRSNVAMCQSNLGNLLAEAGNISEVEELFRNSLVTTAFLVAEFPYRPHYRFYLAERHVSLGRFLRAKLSKPEEAIIQLQQGLEIYEKLAAEFPSMPSYREEMAAGCIDLGQILMFQGRFGEAEDQLRKAIRLHETLIVEFANVPKHPISLSSSYCKLAELMNAKGNSAESLEWFDKAADTIRPEHEKNRRPAHTLDLLASIFSGRAYALGRMKQDSEEDWEKVLEFIPNGGPQQSRIQRAIMQLRAGKVDAAVTEIEALITAAVDHSVAHPWSLVEWFDVACFYSLASIKAPEHQQEYAVRAIVLLSRAVESGFKDAGHIKHDPDLDPLRNRVDFKKLLESIDNAKTETVK